MAGAAEAERGPQADLPDAGIGHPAASSHLRGRMAAAAARRLPVAAAAAALSLLPLLHVYPDAGAAGADTAAAGPAQGDGNDAVDVGEKDGHADGDGEAGQEGGDKQGGRHAARDGENAFVAAGGQVAGVDFSAHPHRQACRLENSLILSVTTSRVVTEDSWYFTIFTAIFVSLRHYKTLSIKWKNRRF